VHDRKWNPDAIVFDNNTAYGTPSYHVQRLFSLNRPDVLLPAELTGPASPQVPGGSIGLGTWRTQAEFDDVQVTQRNRTLFTADFSGGSLGWRPFRGDWRVVDGAYRQTSEAEDVRATAGDVDWNDYTIHLRARKLAGAEGFLVMFRVRDDGDWYWW